MPPGPPPNGPPLPPASQPFPQANGFGFFPPLGVMNTPISNRGRRPSPPFEPSSSEPTNAPSPRATAPCPDSYDNAPLLDNCSPPLIDDGFAARGRMLSTAAGSGTPALPPSAPPMTLGPSRHRVKRALRASSIDTGMRLAGYDPDSNRRPGNVQVKFRLTGSIGHGITLRQALESVRLSRSIAYSLHDFNLSTWGHIALKVRWIGFRSISYDVPVSPEIDGYADLQSLARRIARAIVHFMMFNDITFSRDHVVFHRLEQISPHIWMPVITVRPTK